MRKQEQFLKSLSDVEQKIVDCIEPILEFEKCELIAIKLRNSNFRPLLIIYLDKFLLNEMVNLSQSISAVLDVGNAEFNWFNGPYQLELSSPGIDRPLTKKSHFKNVVGKNIRVKTVLKQIQGILEQVDDNNGISIAGHNSNICWSDILDANLIYPRR